MNRVRSFSLYGLFILTAAFLLSLEPARIDIRGDDVVPLILTRAASGFTAVSGLSSGGVTFATSTSTMTPICITSSTGGGATTFSYATTAGTR